MIDVAIVSERTLLADGVEAILRHEAQIRVVARHTCWAHAASAVPAMRADVMLATYECIARDGAPVGASRPKPSPRIILIADDDDEIDLRPLLRQGIAGLVLTSMPAALLVRSIVKVHQGDLWLEKNAILRHFRREAMTPALCGLSNRESDIVHGVCEGLRNQEIASRLRIAEATVKAHLSHVYAKLHVKSRVELCILAQKWRAGAIH